MLLRYPPGCRYMPGLGCSTEAKGEAPVPPNGASQPRLHQRGLQIQAFGALRRMPIALAHDARAESCRLLNRILADTFILAALYKKHHWLVRGHTSYQLHLLFDQHAAQQAEVIDLLAERVQTLGGVAVAYPRHVAEITAVPRPPDGAEDLVDPGRVRVRAT